MIEIPVCARNSFICKDLFIATLLRVAIKKKCKEGEGGERPQPVNKGNAHPKGMPINREEVNKYSPFRP